MSTGARDPRVEAAIANWAPRLIANGVDYNDFVRTTAGVERWEQWLPAWTETAEMHERLAVEARELANQRSAGEAFLRAAVSYHFAKFVWTLDPARNRAATEAAVRALRAAHALLDPTAERIESPPVVANLRRPPGVARPPLVVLIPGLDSTKEEFFLWESVFLNRGLATLSVDGPGQGESGFEAPIRHDYEVAVGAALDGIGDRPDLDLRRVGAVGVSLGGYYVVRAAAFEPRLKAIAGVSGPFNAAAQWESMPSLTRDAFIHHTGAGSESEGRERAAALDLDGVAELVRQPCLVVTGRRDRVIPWEQTRRIAGAVPGAEWVLYDDGTHVCNNIPFKYRPLVADWIRGQLA
ncbi:MAG TPA: alpha/beta fold hydrolase [Solirubrobacteraceae bacterium]|nr:alpha/beta fold hydrolase [Solirubrobacteraceae bacterium]